MWQLHCIARETGKLGHLHSPRTQIGPWPWFPYAIDNGAFACWDEETNTFNYDRWERQEIEWRNLLLWAELNDQQPEWAVVPDVVGDAKTTLERWVEYAPLVRACGFPLAIAAQDGMAPSDVRALDIQPDVIAIGGSTEFKKETLELWLSEFPRIHILRFNISDRLHELEERGVESIDGTGWFRDVPLKMAALEKWARETATATPNRSLVTKYFKQKQKDKNQLSFL